MSDTADYRAQYDEFWKKIVETDGQPDVEKVARELADYKRLLRDVPRVYKHVTGGKLSNPFYEPSAVLQVTEEHIAERIGWALMEARVLWDAEREDGQP